MDALTINYAFTGVATVAAGVSGWIAPRSRSGISRPESCTLACGLALGVTVIREPLAAIALGLLIPTTYSVFNRARGKDEPSKHSFVLAFHGAALLLLFTSQHWQVIVVGAPLALGGPYVATWLTRHTHRAVGLALLIAATVFQLTRVPLLLDPAGPRSTTPAATVTSLPHTPE